jgi:hypothetical protein
MQHPGGFREEKIMYQSAVAQHRLGAYACHPWLEIGERQARAIFTALGEVALLPQGVSHLLDARCEMRSDDFPKSRKRHVVENIPAAEGEFPIALAGKPKHRVGAGDDSSIDRPGEMNPNKGKFWIWNGIRLINPARDFGKV